MTGRWQRAVPYVVAMVLGALAAGGAAAAEGQAAIHVECTRPVVFGAMAEGAKIHPNRDYAFTRVPEFLAGLPFTSHEHNGPGALSCTVRLPGPVYLCLQAPATPRGIGLDGDWLACGTMDTVIKGRNYPWGIWRLDAAAGRKLSVPAPDRWGAVLAAGTLEGLKAAAANAPRPAAPKRGGPPGPAGGPPDEYAQLAADLANRAWFDRIADQAFCREALILPTDRDGLDVVLRRTAALLADLTARDDAPDLSKAADELRRLASAAQALPADQAAARRELFEQARTLRRRIAFANPLLDFDKLLFIQRHDAGGPFHMCDQYYGCNAKPGGGLFVLCDPFTAQQRLVNVLDGAVVQAGRLKGSPLTGGAFLSPELSFDGRTVLFAWTQGRATETYTWGPEISYHLFRCEVDASAATPAAAGLARLTDGDADDFDPCFLPDGRVVFVSERRGGFLRCGRHCPVYTMFSMNADGTGIERLSHHETHEWHPSVANDGMIVYTRWDYVDRDTNVAHHIWTCYPDGRDPRSFHGNYPARRESRPWMEMSIRAIPGSHRFVATAAAHHGHAFGSLVVIDPSGEDDGAMSQVRRLTPEAPLPEAEGPPAKLMAYATPWPLSEKYYLCAYAPAGGNHGIYLVDCFGNRELIVRDEAIACLDPIPLRPRPRPPVIPAASFPSPTPTASPGVCLGASTPPRCAAGDGSSAPAPVEAQTQAPVEAQTEQPAAPAAVMNVYDSDFAWPEGTRIAALRIIQLLPKSTAPPNRPRIGVADQTNARAALGTVPVERDGSAHFLVPAGRPVYFQALDANGLAVQSMRSVTYAQPGGVLSCQGCHEPKHRPPLTGRDVPLALRRPPSPLAPEPQGANPFSYARLVQPVLDRHCVACHRQKKAVDLSGEPTAGGWTKSYVGLAGKYGFYFDVSNGSIRRGVHGGSRTVAGAFGAQAAPLLKYLDRRHYGVQLPPEDLRRITLWLDCNSEFYGAYENTDAQARGEVVRPSLE